MRADWIDTISKMPGEAHDDMYDELEANNDMRNEPDEANNRKMGGRIDTASKESNESDEGAFQPLRVDMSMELDALLPGYKKFLESSVFDETSIDKRHSNLRVKMEFEICQESTATDMQMHDMVPVSEIVYKCEHCEKICSCSSDLQLHQKVHNSPEISISEPRAIDIEEDMNQVADMHRIKKEIFNCDVCSMAFSDEKELKQHGEVHTNLELYKCALCNGVFHGLEHLSRHEKTHTSKINIKCVLCSKPHDYLSDFIRHEREQHKCGKGPFICELCLKQFLSHSHLIIHKKSHVVDKKSWKCDVCSCTFNDSGSLGVHQKTHACKKEADVSASQPVSEDFSMDMDVLMPSYNKLLESSVYHENSNDSGFSNLHVKMEFDICHEPAATNMLMHNTVHIDEIVYECESCEKTFSSSSDLLLHRAVHDSREILVSDIVGDLNQDVNVPCIKKENFNCDICSMTFSDEKQLKVHSDIHTALELYKCALCNGVFHGLEHLRRHEKKHVSKRKFKCKLCSKIHNYLSDLLRHERECHNGEKGSFVCRVCSKQCLSNSHLIKHMKSHGIKKKSWKCNVCLNTFYDSGSLEIHQRSHSGETEANKAASQPPSEGFALDMDVPMPSCEKLLESSVDHENSSDNRPSKQDVKINGVCHQSAVQSQPMLKTVGVDMIIYNCEHCEETFSSSPDLQSHQKIHNSPEISISESEAFDVVEYLNQVMNEHCVRKEFFNCDVCSMTFSNEKHLKQHSDIHTNLELYKCAWCKGVFHGLEHLNRHEKKHVLKRTFKCKLCPKIHNYLSDLLRHERECHNGEKGPFVCQACSKQCLSNSHLIKHMKSHAVKEKSLKCGLYSNTSCHNKSLKLHQRTHTDKKKADKAAFQPPSKDLSMDADASKPSSKKLLESSTCCEKSSYKESSNPQVKTNDFEHGLCCESASLSLQMCKTVHIDITSTDCKCDCCEKIYSNPSHLKEHRKVRGNHNISVSEFRTSDTLGDSNKDTNVHCVKTTFNCDMCLMTFSNNTQFKQHNEIHTNLELYKCALCRGVFHGLDNLKRHEKKHAAKSKFRCTMCSKIYDYLSNLLCHERDCHNCDRGPFVCQLCSKQCISNSHFIKHMRSHGVRKKIWKCGTCSNTFYNRESLKVHQEMHAGE